MRLNRFVVSLLALLSACTGDLKYDTHSDPEGLRSLKNKPIVILQYSYKDDVLVRVESLEKLLGDRLVAQQKALFIAEMEPIFAVKDVSESVAVRYGANLDFTDTAFVGRLLNEFGADGGFMVTTAYAYEMAPGSLRDELGKGALRRVLPEKAVDVVSGPSQVQAYHFASKTMLFNREGKAIWSFYGKGSGLPTFVSMFKPSEFARSFAGLEPSAQNLAQKLSQLDHEYNKYLAWMIQQDLNDVSTKNYFRDYPSRNKYLSIFPAENTSFVPYVTEYDPLAR